MRAWRRCSVHLVGSVPIVLGLVACGTNIVLVGEPTEDGSGDAATDADVVLPDDIGEDDATEADDVDTPGCPVFAVPASTDTIQDGSREHPFGGLHMAVDLRGPCDRIVLLGGTAETPFDAAVDIGPAAGESLTIEGDPGTTARAELDAHGDVGLFATGEGELMLRHLAVRAGHATQGGCLNAQVGGLVLEDTEWTDCRATERGGAVWVTAADVRISRSAFLRNRIDDPAIGERNGGGVWLDGPRDRATVLVETSRFEDNLADDGGGLAIETLTDDIAVQDCLFRGNVSTDMGAALSALAGKIAHNRFEANGPSAMGPVVLLWSPRPGTVVRHNVFLDNQVGSGVTALIFAYGTVRNNVFAGNVCDPRWATRGGDCFATVRVVSGVADVRNNTFADNTSTNAIAHLAFDAAFVSGRSNLFVGGEGAGAVGTLELVAEVSAPMSYNATWLVPDPIWGEGVQLGEGNAEADPLFSGLADDYQLGAGSACIDAGDPDPALDDVDGSRNDVGAFGGPDGAWTFLPEGGTP